ncbi:transport protein [Salmonella enterica subsp. enterica]|nr:transport protein [Salmonella enterica subsp. enterica]EDV9435887.1 transport protein [Salmonella enterica subsp. enterica]EDY4901085.1 transport protein [Salmonella enterica]EDZ0486001.1 transport protein [Salmonella enterica]HAU6711423.1 transport protein [Salmonella enterica subsp. enterica serovar Casablanca]
MQTLTRVLPPLRLIMFCQSGENPAQFPDTGGLCVEDSVRLRTPEGLLDRLRRWPGAMVISAGRPSTQLLLWQQVFQRYPRTVVFCSSNAFLPVDVSVEGYFRHLRLIKCAMPVRVLVRMAELAMWSSVQTSLYEEEMKNVLSVPELVMEINSRTLVRLLSERLPKQGRRVLGLLLSGCSPEMTARMLGTGVRQVWLAEQTLKQRWDIPAGVPLPDAVRIRMPDVNPDINQPIALVKAGAGNASDLR